MDQNNSSEDVLRNIAETILGPLNDGFSSLNEVYQALIKADVDYDYIRQHLVQAHQHLEQSQQMASSGLECLKENLGRLTQDEGRLEFEINDAEQNLKTVQALLRESQEALEQAKRNLKSAKQTVQDQQNTKHNQTIIFGVGAGLATIPFIGWITGLPMLISGGLKMGQAERAITEAKEEVRKYENEVKKYEDIVSEYESKISQIRCNINQKREKLKQTRERIQKVKKQSEAVADFQNKLRSSINFLSDLIDGVAEHQTRRFILQEPVMKVMEDVIKAMKEITGNELLYNTDMLELVDQIKENN